MGTLEVNLPPQTSLLTPKGESIGLIQPVEAEFHQALEDVGPEQRPIGEFPERQKRDLPHKPMLPSSGGQQVDSQFNEYVTGMAYLSEIRLVSNRNKVNEYVVRMFVLQGGSQNVHYEYHELAIVTEDVLKTALSYVDALERRGNQLLVKFKMANPRARAFLYNVEGGDEVRLGSVVTGLLTYIELVETEQNQSTDQFGPKESKIREHMDFTFEKS